MITVKAGCYQSLHISRYESGTHQLLAVRWQKGPRSNSGMGTMYERNAQLNRRGSQLLSVVWTLDQSALHPPVPSIFPGFCLPPGGNNVIGLRPMCSIQKLKLQNVNGP
jgi:hypothetical protein